MTNHSIDHDESYGQRVQEGACGPTAEDLNASGDAFSRKLAHENLSVYPGKRPEDCTKEELEDPATLTLANGNLLSPQYLQGVRAGQEQVYRHFGPLDEVRADLEAEEAARLPSTYPMDEMVFKFQVSPESLERLKDKLPRPLVSITATGYPKDTGIQRQSIGHVGWVEDVKPDEFPVMGENLDPLPNLDVFVVYAKLDHTDHHRLAFAFYVDSATQADAIVNTLNQNLKGLEMEPVYGWARVTNLADLMLEGM